MRSGSSLSPRLDGVLDALTNGGPACPSLAFRIEGYFMPFRMIEVVPFGIARILSTRGIEVCVEGSGWAACVDTRSVLTRFANYTERLKREAMLERDRAP